MIGGEDIGVGGVDEAGNADGGSGGSSGGGGLPGASIDLFLSYGHGVPGVDDQLALEEGGYEAWLSPTDGADIQEPGQRREWLTPTALAKAALYVRVDSAQMNSVGGPWITKLVVTVTQSDGTESDTGIEVIIPPGTTTDLTLAASGAISVDAGGKIGVAFSTSGELDTGSTLRCEARLVAAATAITPVIPAPSSPPTGMVLWLKADVGVSRAGANVTGWADQSGNARNAGPLTAAGTRAPQYTASALNGLPGIGGTQAADAQGLKFTGPNLFTTLAPRTIFAVVTFDGTSTFSQKGGVLMSFRRNSPSFSPVVESPFTFGPHVADQRVFTFEQSPVNSVFASTPVDYSGEAKLFRWITDSPNPATTIQLYDNGTPIPQGTTAIPATTESGLSTGYIVGCLIEDNGADVFQGMLHEIIVYAGVLSPAQITQAEAYLRGKWGL